MKSHLVGAEGREKADLYALPHRYLMVEYGL